MTLTKAALAERLFTEVGLNNRESHEFVDALFEVLTERLEWGYSLRLSGFGNFKVRSKTERPGRNPKTGEMFAVSARRVVVFHPGAKFSRRVDTGMKSR